MQNGELIKIGTFKTCWITIKKWLKGHHNHQRVSSYSKTKNSSDGHQFEPDPDGCDYDDEMCFRESYF